ncbi:hypothetical protein NSK_006833 [Nannochloropsis salina CCMP1776]|uniref:Uncharacterized protein n=1 Tax=Nannochloropsis salina CCMP1776 TaxID=1027361 RepID=A0A4D9CQX6_9STRA|nr:hypothetical protein NSK_006833 [Nannochloropsis salina CCMP1776]|eukprot:TFJ81582.1 hypothetical protein NSK_006833 [Nannochloropsis salina CCMP1776]
MAMAIFAPVLLLGGIPSTNAFLHPLRPAKTDSLLASSQRHAAISGPMYAQRDVMKMVNPSEWQASWLQRIRSRVSPPVDKPSVSPVPSQKEKKERTPAKAASTSNSRSSPTVGVKNSDAKVPMPPQQLSRFTAAVIEEESAHASAVEAEKRELKTLKGIPDTFLKDDIVANDNTVRQASAVVGALAGFALGGPWLALVGAAWTSYSCTVTPSDAGEAARGTGKWALNVHNFMAKMNRKHGYVQKLSQGLGGWYRRFRKETAPDATFLDVAESSVQSALEATDQLRKDLDVAGPVERALITGGEWSAGALRSLIRLNEENRVTERLWEVVAKR